MKFTTDPDGQELLLKDGEFQVMMEWEKPYMEACIDALKPSGDVLEIGFGLGYSAAQIQKYKPKSHTIIEYHPVVVEKARAWARDKPNVTIIEATWQDTLATLGTFDTIFFDDYPLESQNDLNACETAVKDHSSEMAAIAKETEHLKPKSYTDADIQMLLDQIQPTDRLSPSFYQTFFTRRLMEKQITPLQFENIQNHLKNIGIDMEMPNSQPRGPGDRLITFLKPVLRNHLRSKGRFSCYLETTTSMYQNTAFRNLVINDPFLDYTEKNIAVEVSPYCKYFQGDQALIMVITKIL